ncbi:MAG: methyltransferase domain-containing protein, partial [Rhizobiales bacterium]|nr:methyltransferase domain-containing protein [Hyphomicrobiales bacterium]
ERQGPGDDTFSLDLLGKLPTLASDCAIADLGCGTGIASVLLAQHFRRPVLCVDTSEEFLKSLSQKAETLGIGPLIKTRCADMGTLDPQTHRFDLLWSEGAAYNLTFEGAMRKWRPLMAKNGIAVVSELSWFTSERPEEISDYWHNAYPEIADEQVNAARAEAHDFELLFTERLPESAWWRNYYNPLLDRLAANAESPSKMMQEVILETRREIDLFRTFSAYFGYTFYVLKAV